MFVPLFFLSIIQIISLSGNSGIGAFAAQKLSGRRGADTGTFQKPMQFPGEIPLVRERFFLLEKKMGRKGRENGKGTFSL